MHAFWFASRSRSDWTAKANAHPHWLLKFMRCSKQDFRGDLNTGLEFDVDAERGGTVIPSHRQRPLLQMFGSPLTRFGLRFCLSRHSCYSRHSFEGPNFFEPCPLMFRLCANPPPVSSIHAWPPNHGNPLTRCHHLYCYCLPQISRKSSLLSHPATFAVHLDFTIVSGSSEMKGFVPDRPSA